MRLEKQLEEAKKRLTDAEVELKRITEELEPKIAPLRAELKEAKAEHDAARLEYMHAYKQMRVKMGIDTKAWRAQVAKWAGFTSLEEAEEHAVERGKSLLDEAAQALGEHLLARHKRVQAAKQAREAAADRQARIEYGDLYLLQRPIRDQESVVRHVQCQIRDIEQKMVAARQRRHDAKPKPQPQDKAQHTRLVVARQKLRNATLENIDRSVLVTYVNNKLKENAR